jgi:hypothetical protein
VDHFDEIQPGGGGRLMSAEREQLPGDAGRTRRSLEDLVEVVASLIVVGEVPVQELRIPADRREHVVEVVRDAAGKLTEGLELL